MVPLSAFILIHPALWDKFCGSNQSQPASGRRENPPYLRHLSSNPIEVLYRRRGTIHFFSRSMRRLGGRGGHLIPRVFTPRQAIALDPGLLMVQPILGCYSKNYHSTRLLAFVKIRKLCA